MSENSNDSSFDDDSLSEDSYRQETINSFLEEMQAAQVLMTIQSALEVGILNLHKFKETVDASEAINPQFAQQYLPMLQTQTEYLKQPQQFSHVIVQMRQEGIHVQNVPITYLTTILATTPQKTISVQNASSLHANTKHSYGINPKQHCEEHLQYSTPTRKHQRNQYI